MSACSCLKIPIGWMKVYAIHRQRDEGPDTAQATTFRERYAREIKIKFLGIWDTVGALGIPLHALQWLNAREYAFHDTELSGIVENAAHSVAIDEWRIDYQVTLWSPTEKEQNVEQRWFIGAHANVGGGYPDRRLSDITLNWMLTQATATGLVIDPASNLQNIADNWRADPVNSYQEFLAGIYAKTHDPYYRPMQVGLGLNEVVDGSVKKRFEGGVGYAPKNTGFEMLISAAGGWLTPLMARDCPIDPAVGSPHRSKGNPKSTPP